MIGNIYKLFLVFTAVMLLNTGSVFAEDMAKKEMVKEGEICEEVIEVIDLGGGEEEISMKRGHSHNCRPGVVPWPRFTIGADTAAVTGCERDELVEQILKDLGTANCTGDKEPQCDGACGDEDCKVFARPDRNGTGAVRCTRIRMPECAPSKGYSCMAKVGRYKCDCTCQ